MGYERLRQAVTGADVGAVGRFRRDLAAARARMDVLDRHVVDLRSGRVEYADEGEGLPALASHGVCGGLQGGLWLARRVLGTSGFRVIAPSRFGYQGTTLPAGASSATQADQFAELLDHLAIDRAVVVGFSAGTTSVLQMGFRHPDRVLAAICVSSNVPGPHLTSTQRVPRFLRPAFGSDVAWWIFRTYFPKAYEHFIGVPRGWRPSAEDVEAMAEIVDSLVPIGDRADGVIFDTFASNPDINRPFGYEAMAVPLLLVHARDDPLAPYSGAEALARRLPSARFVTLANGGHLNLGDAEHQVRGHTQRFLSDRLGER